MNKIAFRVDGGKNIGMGHIMRTLVLAKELSKDNEITYICISNKEDDYRAGINKVKSEGFPVIEINEQNIVEQLKVIQDMNYFNCLITDSYSVNSEYFNETNKIFNKTGYFDDVNICEFNLDFLINQNIDAFSHNYKFTNEDTTTFLGTQYCLLREEFRTEKTFRDVYSRPSNILITLGGMDNNYNTVKVLNSIKDLDLNFNIVIGSAFDKNLVEILKEVSKTDERINLYENANMSELMKKNDLCISACGSTLYELCAMRLPTIGLVIADNQKNICKYMNEANLIIGLDMEFEVAVTMLPSKLKELVCNGVLREQLVKRQGLAVKPDGVIKVAEGINNILLN